MGVLQESPSSHTDGMLPARAGENPRDNQGPAEIPLKSKYRLSLYHSGAPHCLLLPPHGLLSWLVFPSSGWGMEAKQEIWNAWGWGPLRKSQEPQILRKALRDRRNTDRAKAEHDCSKNAGLTQKRNGGTLETLERALGAQSTLSVGRAMQIHNYCS